MGIDPYCRLCYFFKLISKSLLGQKNGYKVFDFTESSEYIELYKNADEIEIHPSFRADIIITNFTEFYNEVDRFYNAVIEDIFHANSFLRQNEEFLRIINI